MPKLLKKVKQLKNHPKPSPSFFNDCFKRFSRFKFDILLHNFFFWGCSALVRCLASVCEDDDDFFGNFVWICLKKLLDALSALRILSYDAVSWYGNNNFFWSNIFLLDFGELIWRFSKLGNFRELLGLDVWDYLIKLNFIFLSQFYTKNIFYSPSSWWHFRWIRHNSIVNFASWRLGLILRHTFAPQRGAKSARSLGSSSSSLQVLLAWRRDPLWRQQPQHLECRPTQRIPSNGAQRIRGGPTNSSRIPQNFTWTSDRELEQAATRRAVSRARGQMLRDSTGSSYCRQGEG